MVTTRKLWVQILSFLQRKGLSCFQPQKMNRFIYATTCSKLLLDNLFILLPQPPDDVGPSWSHIATSLQRSSGSNVAPRGTSPLNNNNNSKHVEAAVAGGVHSQPRKSSLRRPVGIVHSSAAAAVVVDGFSGEPSSSLVRLLLLRPFRKARAMPMSRRRDERAANWRSNTSNCGTTLLDCCSCECYRRFPNSSESAIRNQLILLSAAELSWWKDTLKFWFSIQMPQQVGVAGEQMRLSGLSLRSFRTTNPKQLRRGSCCTQKHTTT